jgi:PPK2 family polyphosphate:nucleotide phosphotransferase
MAKSAKKSKGKSGGTTVAGSKGSGGKGVKGTKGDGGKGNGGRSSGGNVAAEAGPGAGVAAAADVEDASAATAFTVALRAGQGFTLSALDPRSTPGFSGGKAGAAALTASTDAELDDLQERLYAESRTGGTRAILLVVQGMDTAGKGGIMRHVVGSVDPQGVRYTAFKAPTAQERAHPFLWRIRNALPAPGQIGVFDRSHYEDVLIARVHDLVPRATWARRYAQINTFESSVVESGTTVVKVMLHLSSEEQKSRLGERLERPDKYWKYNPGDIDERAQWPAYQEAYQAVLDKCSTDAAPWFVVPADRKWYARLAVQQLLLEHLRLMAPQWPGPDFDIEVEKERLART